MNIIMMITINIINIVIVTAGDTAFVAVVVVVCAQPFPRGRFAPGNVFPKLPHGGIEHNSTNGIMGLLVRLLVVVHCINITNRHTHTHDLLFAIVLLLLLL